MTTLEALEEESQTITNVFFGCGAEVSKKHYDYVYEKILKTYEAGKREGIETCIQVVQKEQEGWYDAGEGFDVEYSAREMKDEIIKALAFLKDKSK